jgi:hypothetical protein
LRPKRQAEECDTEGGVGRRLGDTAAASGTTTAWAGREAAIDPDIIEEDSAALNEAVLNSRPNVAPFISGFAPH